MIQVTKQITSASSYHMPRKKSNVVYMSCNQEVKVQQQPWLLSSQLDSHFPFLNTATLLEMFRNQTNKNINSQPVITITIYIYKILTKPCIRHQSSVIRYTSRRRPLYLSISRNMGANSSGKSPKLTRTSSVVKRALLPAPGLILKMFFNRERMDVGSNPPPLPLPGWLWSWRGGGGGRSLEVVEVEELYPCRERRLDSTEVAERLLPLPLPLPCPCSC